MNRVWMMFFSKSTQNSHTIYSASPAPCFQLPQQRGALLCALTLDCLTGKSSGHYSWAFAKFSFQPYLCSSWGFILPFCAQSRHLAPLSHMYVPTSERPLFYFNQRKRWIGTISQQQSHFFAMDTKSWSNKQKAMYLPKFVSFQQFPGIIIGSLWGRRKGRPLCLPFLSLPLVTLGGDIRGNDCGSMILAHLKFLLWNPVA